MAGIERLGFFNSMATPNGNIDMGQRPARAIRIHRALIDINSSTAHRY